MYVYIYIYMYVFMYMYVMLCMYICHLFHIMSNLLKRIRQLWPVDMIFFHTFFYLNIYFFGGGSVMARRNSLRRKCLQDAWWHTCDWVLCALVIWHIWVSHVTHMNESCHSCEWSCRWYEWSQVWLSYVTHTNSSFHMCECGMSPVSMSHGTRVNRTCHSYRWVLSLM